MTDQVRVALGAAFVSFGLLAVVVGGGAYAYAWYTAVAWSQSAEARRLDRATVAPPPIWLEDEAGAAATPADDAERRASGMGVRDAAGPRDGDGMGSGGDGATTATRVAASSTSLVPSQPRHPLEDAERETAGAWAGLLPRRATADDVGVADVDFRFLDPPEPGAHARLQLAVRNHADVPTGPVSIVIPARWFESFDVLGAVPDVLLDRTEQDGRRYFDYPVIGPAETVTLELHVLATDEDLDAPEVRVVLRDEEAEVARAQPRTVAPKPRPGPARHIQIPSLNIRAGVVPTVWEPPEFVVGQIRDSAAVSLGNTVLIGHLRGPAGNVFNRLDRARLGDEVVAVSRGIEFQFVVSDIMVLPNTDSSPMLPTETPRLTLMTCAGTWYPFRQDYSHRLWVIAEPPELAEQTIAANRERAARAAEELARIEAEAEQAAATATASASAEGATPEGSQAGDGRADPGSPVTPATPAVPGAMRTTPQASVDPPTVDGEEDPPIAPVADSAGAVGAALGATGVGVPTAQVGSVAAAGPPAATPFRLPEPPLLTIREPAPDARVPPRLKLRGELIGEQRPSGRLWLAVRADIEGSHWYLFGQEIRPDRDGRWELELELGGPPDIRHEIRIGSVDEPTHARLMRHVKEQPGTPLAELPEQFEAQATVSVVRR